VRIIYSFLAALFILTVTVTAGLQFGIPWHLTADWVSTFCLIPLSLMVIAILRLPASVPSWLAFSAGLAVDTLTHGVLGYWALTYTLGTLLVRQIPIALSTQLITRCGMHALIGVSIFILHAFLNSIGFLGDPAWIGIAYSVMRMLIFAVIVEIVLAFWSNLSFRFGEFGHLA